MTFKSKLRFFVKAWEIHSNKGLCSPHCKHVCVCTHARAHTHTHTHTHTRTHTEPASLSLTELHSRSRKANLCQDSMSLLKSGNLACSFLSSSLLPSPSPPPPPDYEASCPWVSSSATSSILEVITLVCNCVHSPKVSGRISVSQELSLWHNKYLCSQNEGISVCMGSLHSSQCFFKTDWG